jgi:hypothetical protein
MKKLIALLFMVSGSAFAGNSSLTWDYGTYDMAGNPNGLTATVIMRKAEACASSTLAFSQLVSVPFPTLAYVDSAVTNGKTYCYEAFSVNPAGNSGMSNVVAKTIPFDVPAAPNLLVK